MRRVRLKHVARIIMGQSPASDEINDIGVGMPFLQGNGEFGAVYPDAKSYCNVSPKRAVAGDLLLSVRAPVGAMNFADREYGIGRGLCAIRPIPSELERRFANYTLAASLDNLKSVAVGSTYDAVTTSDVGALEIHHADVAFQVAVADFLDRETAEADALMVKYERLIELLGEKRIALITQAVTKGLDPSVPMKDSGIDWVGKMPAHWEVSPLKHIFNFEKGKNAQRLTHEYIHSHPGDHPVYSGQTENAGIMGLIGTFDYDLPEVLFSTTVGARVMTPLTLRGRFSLSQNCLIGIPRSRNCDVQFCYYALYPLFRYERSAIPDHMQPSLRISDISKFKIPVPPVQEQRNIAKSLDQANKDLDSLIETARRAIHLTLEHRSALIAAAVTGQIDVNNYRSIKQPIEVPA